MKITSEVAIIEKVKPSSADEPSLHDPPSHPTSVPASDPAFRDHILHAKCPVIERVREQIKVLTSSLGDDRFKPKHRSWLRRYFYYVWMLFLLLLSIPFILLMIADRIRLKPDEDCEHEKDRLSVY